MPLSVFDKRSTKTATRMRKYFALFVVLLCSCSRYHYYQTTDTIQLYPSETSTTYQGTIPAGEIIGTTSKKKKRNKIRYYHSSYAWASLDNCIYLGNNLSSTGVSTSGSSSANNGSSGSSGGPVHVKGYTKKNGSYVKPYTRRAPARH